MTSSAFWRRTPPALFPATLGMFGLSLAWRAASRTLGAPDWPADVLAAGTGAFFAFAFLCYLAKICVRPAAVMTDLSPAPGRAAVSAGSMCLMLAAAALHGALGGSLSGAMGDRILLAAQGIWAAGVALHLVYMVCVVVVLAGLNREERVVTPVLFLPFVGLIVSPLGGVSLGFEGLSRAAFLYALFAGAAVFALSAPRYLLRPTPIPNRAAAAIFLAPAAVAAVAAAQLGYDGLAAAFVVLSCAVAAILLARLRWLTAGGFTPLWGAFTFPSAAFASALVLAAARWAGPWTGLAWVALAAATLVVPPIWALTVRAWALGRLAPATGAKVV